ncbi:VOC family protein [Nocardia abscessus]|uniref:VOC family protein n=2 Tax=Nocardia abscessus TaxID=120957 RepID=A0ABS0CFX8_9NOCA|nr:MULTISPECIES: VOC family protein [Nocardia]MBF6222472.1 VOC family protein [Nocardia abscessus]MBF6228755.1 VOC family protein [Nocardia abscessus]
MPTMPAGSILLGSTRARELRKWYLEVLAPDHTGDGPIVLGELMLVIDQRDDVSDANPEPGRSILNFHVDNFAAFETQLDAAGVEWVARATDRPSGRFATFKDPDGNYLQIIQFVQRPH